MTDLVVISLERWDDIWRRNQHVISRLIAADPTLRVLFVEPPDDPVHALRSGGKPSFGQELTEAGERLWTLRPVKWLPRRIDPKADERLARVTLQAAHQLGMTAPLLWVNDPGAAMVSHMSGWPTLYDMTDDWVTADRPAHELERITAGERMLLHTATEVVACSTELARRKSTIRPDIHVIRNGVDTAAYLEPRPRPADLPQGESVVYLGTLHRDRLDVDLCLATATVLRGRGTLVLVGPNLLSEPDTTQLRDAGVLVLGSRPHDAVIGYLQHADALVVPHLVSPFTDSLDPIKLYEYQAVGRPVVSTPVAGFRDANDPRIVVTEATVFPDALLAALDANPGRPVRRRREAEVNASDWSERVARFQEVLAGMQASGRG